MIENDMIRLWTFPSAGNECLFISWLCLLISLNQEEDFNQKSFQDISIEIYTYIADEIIFSSPFPSTFLSLCFRLYCFVFITFNSGECETQIWMRRKMLPLWWNSINIIKKQSCFQKFQHYNWIKLIGKQRGLFDIRRRRIQKYKWIDFFSLVLLHLLHFTFLLLFYIAAK